MKKKIYIVLAVLICLTIIVGLAKIAVSAEDEIPTDVDTNAVESESMPIEEGENSASITVPTTDEIIKWVEQHLEEISVIVTLIATLFYQVRKHASLNKSIATCNNNAVSIVENSNGAIQTALAKVEAVSDVVDKYKEEIVNLLAEIRQSAEEKKKLEAALADVEAYLKTAKLANVELSNELAELLILANIPNSKKEELYSRHRAAINALDAVEASAKITEVKENVGEEA